MEMTGIICEYNPFHRGHLRQLRLARAELGEDCAIVCLMSGNYVQRGEPALFPKSLRAEAALRCGADLVLELPLTAALSSAEGFAAQGVRILSALGCENLCFGTESQDFSALQKSAEANLDPAFDGLLRGELEKGQSYAAARQRVLEALGAGAGLSSPNDILAVEYLKALRRQNSLMKPLPIHRPDTYHASTLDPEAPSASALRAALGQTVRKEAHCLSKDAAAFRTCHSERGEESASSVSPWDWRSAVPSCLIDLYENAPLHSWQAGERAALAILRTLPDAVFQELPFGSEGLWSKLMKNCRRCASTEEIIQATLSKRYTRTRVQRMLLCALLALSREDLERPAPYVRILGFTEGGRSLLRRMKARFPLVNAGQQPPDSRYYALETRASDLYDLFSVAAPRPAGEEARLRICRVTGEEPKI